MPVPDTNSEPVVSRLTSLWKQLQSNSDVLNRDVISNSESASAVSAASFRQSRNSPSASETANVTEEMTEFLPSNNADIHSSWNFVNKLISAAKSSEDRHCGQAVVSWRDNVDKSTEAAESAKAEEPAEAAKAEEAASQTGRRTDL